MKEGQCSCIYYCIGERGRGVSMRENDPCTELSTCISDKLSDKRHVVKIYRWVDPFDLYIWALFYTRGSGTGLWWHWTHFIHLYKWNQLQNWTLQRLFFFLFLRYIYIFYLFLSGELLFSIMNDEQQNGEN